MRASFQRDLELQESYSLKGDSAHHLLNVVRIGSGEEILLLNGKGLRIKTLVSFLSKKELTLKLLEVLPSRPGPVMDLALGVPKKEALELSLKQAVELGFRKIYLIRSQYSQTRLPDVERIESLLISALEQSNSAFLPEIFNVAWNEIPLSGYGDILVLDSQNETQGKANLKKSECLLVVGPEGGFSPEELTLLHSWPKVRVINLPTPILRTPTAVAAGAGILLGSLLE